MVAQRTADSQGNSGKTQEEKNSQHCKVSVAPSGLLIVLHVVFAGSSDVTTTTMQAATTASRRLLQSGSTQNIGVNLNLPAGTNISDVVALLTAASANNGTGTLLTAAQQACVSIHMFLYSIPLAPSVVACVGLFHLPCPLILCCYKSMKFAQNDVSLSSCCHVVCIPHSVCEWCVYVVQRLLLAGVNLCWGVQGSGRIDPVAADLCQRC